jgi:hypothetical protein
MLSIDVRYKDVEYTWENETIGPSHFHTRGINASVQKTRNLLDEGMALVVLLIASSDVESLSSRVGLVRTLVVLDIARASESGGQVQEIGVVGHNESTTSGSDCWGTNTAEGPGELLQVAASSGSGWTGCWSGGTATARGRCGNRGLGGRGCNSNGHGGWAIHSCGLGRGGRRRRGVSNRRGNSGPTTTNSL